MLLGSSENKDSVGRRFFECFEQCIEGTGREHMYLVDDIDGVLTYLWRNAHFLNKCTYILDGVIGGRVEFVYIERALFVESEARFALVTSVVFWRRVKTVNCFSEDTRAGCFSDASWSAEEVSVSEVVLSDGVTQCLCKCVLTDHRFEGGGSIFPSGNDIFHIQY